MTKSTRLALSVAGSINVSALVTLPKTATACMVFAHGAGAGMNHPYIVAVCDGLAARGVATLRYQFPYMEKGGARPDPPKVCHRTVEAAVAAARALMPGLPLFAGGKSFGARMTSQAQAVAPLASVRGLCFFGFPLHPPKEAGAARAEHLSAIRIPMLFLQGTRDPMAQLPLIKTVVARLKEAPAKLSVIEHADHSFHVLVRSGTTDTQVMGLMLDETLAWATAVSGR